MKLSNLNKSFDDKDINKEQAMKVESINIQKCIEKYQENERKA